MYLAILVTFYVGIIYRVKTKLSAFTNSIRCFIHISRSFILIIKSITVVLSTSAEFFIILMNAATSGLRHWNFIIFFFYTCHIYCEKSALFYWQTLCALRSYRVTDTPFGFVCFVHLN